MRCSKPLNLGSIDMHPNERLLVDVELYDNLARRWEPHYLFRAGEYIRPGNGYAYMAVSDFTSGYREPRWPVDIGAIVFDGSGEWQASVANYNGIDIVSNASALIPDDLSLFAAVSWQGSRVRVPVSGGISGESYECSVDAQTASGQIIVAMFAIRCSSERRC